jgi:serine/threonine-protein kinase
LAHFELLEYVGGGGMGRVFRALDTRLGRTVAVKALSRQQASDMDTLMRFRNEARSAARLNHPGIAQVFYVGEEDGLPFIAFEFVEGVNIRDLVAQKGALPLAEALSYALQVAEALSHASARNVVHRDIKPSNVLITSQGRAKLIDMGLARMQKLGSSIGDLTATGVTLGTFDYIAPEQARDPRNADTRSDVYSLGCTLFYMLTGRPPFPEGTVLQKLLQHQEIDPPEIRQFRPDLPEEVSRLLRRMMAKEPHRRYQDATKLIEALLSLAEQVGLRSLGPGQMAWTEPEEPRRALLLRHLPWIAPIAALLVIVALLHVFWAPPTEQIEPSWPSWANAERPRAEKPRVEEARPAGISSSDAKTPLPEPKPEPEASVPAPKPALADAGSQQAPGPGEAQSAGPGPGPPVTSPHNVDVTSLAEVAGSSPLGEWAARRNGTGLRPEWFAGAVSVPEQDASGLLPAAPSGRAWGALDGAAGAATEVADAGPVVKPAPQSSEALIVDPSADGASVFPTLSAACAAARSGDVIELRFNGRLEEEPLEVAGLDLTIRAAEGVEPVVAFRPSEIDPIGYPRSMLALIDSRLTLARVHLEFEIARELPSDRWSLFEMGEAEQVKLENCRLTIRNASGQRGAYHQDVAFFRLKAGPGRGLLIDDEPSEATGPVTVELVDSVVRGEAVFLWIEDLRPVRLDWTNGFLVTTEQLLVSAGGDRPPEPSQSIEINLQNLTAVADRGLCRLNHAEFAPHQLPTQVSCAESLILLGAGASLVEQVDVRDVEAARERITWVGEQNTYQGFTDFWTIRARDPSISPEQRDFESWQAHWGEDTSQLSPVERDDLPGPDRPAHSLEPEDYPGGNGPAAAPQ